MAKYYAWSNFVTERNDAGMTTKSIAVGEEVTQSKLGVTDEEWQEYIDLGTVRTDKYPDIASDVAPAEHFKNNPEEAPAGAPGPEVGSASAPTVPTEESKDK